MTGTTLWRLFCAFVLCSAIAPARAQEDCEAPPRPARSAKLSQPENYRSVFRECRNGAGAKRLAIREMKIAGDLSLLTVDASTLETRIERSACWRCEDTTDAAQSETRFVRAIRAADADTTPRNGALFNGGLTHGAGGGSFLTGDLCPSSRALDRAFFEGLSTDGGKTPIALAVSGHWITGHRQDFDWLRDKTRSGSLDIVWVNHSLTHPYVRGGAETRTYLLTPGIDLDREIFETERLLIAHGETPSVFFRFPGLMSDAALMDGLAQRHLIALGADSWLVLSPAPHAGSILLVHPNGNEPEGLRLFSRLLRAGKTPLPFRTITEAP